MANKREYQVYRLRNPKRKEIYYGVTKNYKARWKEHYKGEVIETSHWDFVEDRARDILLDDKYTKSKATKKVEELRLSGPPNSFKGYVVIAL